MKTFLNRLSKIRIQAVLILLLILSFGVSSCSFFKKKEDVKNEKGKAIAKVQDSYLYESDIVGVFKDKTTKQDSIVLRRDFINNWVKEQLLFYKALANLSDQEKNKEEELNTYYHSLIKYEYEQKFIEQNLDKTVSDSEVVKYYNSNKDIFNVTRCLVKILFFQVPQKAPDLKKAIKWFSSSSDKDQDLLHQYCMGNAIKYSLDLDKWFYFDEIVRIIPIKEFDCINLRQNIDFELTDSNFYYMFNFKEIRHEGTISPLEFEKEKIRNILLHKRRIELIKKMEDNVFKEAMDKNYFKIYE
jgi:hypothetical protein